MLHYSVETERSFKERTQLATSEHEAFSDLIAVFFT
jgi:hypothetical protein